MYRGAAIMDCNAENDAASLVLERRWFASMKAVTALQAECEVLREVLETADEAWRRARQQLSRLEALRDALGDELARCDETTERPAKMLASVASAA